MDGKQLVALALELIALCVGSLTSGHHSSVIRCTSDHLHDLQLCALSLTRPKQQKKKLNLILFLMYKNEATALCYFNIFELCSTTS